VADGTAQSLKTERRGFQRSTFLSRSAPPRRSEQEQVSPEFPARWPGQVSRCLDSRRPFLGSLGGFPVGIFRSLGSLLSGLLGHFLGPDGVLFRGFGHFLGGPFGSLNRPGGGFSPSSGSKGPVP